MKTILKGFGLYILISLAVWLFFAASYGMTYDTGMVGTPEEEARIAFIRLPIIALLWPFWLLCLWLVCEISKKLNIIISAGIGRLFSKRKLA
ncbi:hypothetical protein KKA15_03545 [Patescibacteria group bacterium]|nr:hypothetical protein [Patescibacteria group bacterium]